MPVPEQRTPQRLYMQEGYALTKASGPRQLIKCIHHASIGLYLLFKAGYVHRDVSSGNILLLPEAEQRDCFERFGHSLKWCTGVIIDGDQAIRWDVSGSQATSRSGTLAFISLRLLVAWAEQVKVRATPIDDLEACFWVVISSALDIGEERATEDLAKIWLRNMEAEPSPMPPKSALLGAISSDVPRPPPWSVQLLRPLLTKLQDIILPAQQKVSKAMKTNLDINPILGLVDETFEKFLVVLNEMEDTLPENWITNGTNE